MGAFRADSMAELGFCFFFQVGFDFGPGTVVENAFTGGAQGMDSPHLADFRQSSLQGYVAFLQHGLFLRKQDGFST